MNEYLPQKSILVQKISSHLSLTGQRTLGQLALPPQALHCPFVVGNVHTIATLELLIRGVGWTRCYVKEGMRAGRRRASNALRIAAFTQRVCPPPSWISHLDWQCPSLNSNYRAKRWIICVSVSNFFCTSVTWYTQDSRIGRMSRVPGITQVEMGNVASIKCAHVWPPFSAEEQGASTKTRGKNKLSTKYEFEGCTKTNVFPTRDLSGGAL